MRVTAAATASTAVAAAVAFWLAGLGLAADGSTSPATAAAAEVSAAFSARTPGCTSATASAPELAGEPAAVEPVPGSPFGVVVTPDGRWSFVSLNSPDSIGIFRVGSADSPFLVRQVDTGDQVQPLGEALTPGGRYLLVADGGSGAVVVSVSRAESGQPGALLGTLGDQPGAPPAAAGRGPGGLPDTRCTIGSLGGAIEVAISPDGRFAFVSLENLASIFVYNLQQALTGGFGPADLVGVVPVGVNPVGMAVSPDGRWLYAASEIAANVPTADLAALGGPGTLTVISLARAESDPAASVVATIDAGCSPAWVTTSPDGRVVWVTARGSDRLLGFSAARLLSDPARSLIASVAVGEAPVGLALVDHGQQIVVADSDRFGAPGAVSSLAVVDVASALAGRPALLGYLPAGSFPRQLALEPGGQTLLVTNFSSQQLESVGLTDPPRLTSP